MSKRRIQIKLVPRDPTDSPEHVEFAQFCIQSGIEVVLGGPYDEAETPSADDPPTIKDEGLETDSRLAALSELDDANRDLVEAEAIASQGSGEKGQIPLPEPQEVVSRMRNASNWAIGMLGAGWYLTVQAAAEGAMKAIMDRTKGD